MREGTLAVLVSGLLVVTAGAEAAAAAGESPRWRSLIAPVT